MLTIKNFRAHFRSAILQRGKEYVRQGRVRNLTCSPDGAVHATVQGSQEYQVQMQVSPDGTVTKPSCNCPYSDSDYCKHLAAVFILLEKNFQPTSTTISSSGIEALIRQYNDRKSEVEALTYAEKVRIIPILSYFYDLKYELKIGKSRMYTVGNIQKLYSNFQHHLTQKYGKELEFRHTYEALDEKSRELLEFSFLALHYGQSYSFSDRSVSLKGIVLDRFFELIRNDTISFEEKDCSIRFEDPKLTFTITPAKNDRFQLGADSALRLLGIGEQHACFLDPQTDTLYLTTPRFTKTVLDLFSYLSKNSEVYISKADVPAFYTAVIKPMRDLVHFAGLEALDAWIPPDMVPQLYLDYGADNEIIGNLTFSYGDKTISAFDTSQSPKMHFDPVAENRVIEQVLRYFSRNLTSVQHPLVIVDSDAIYAFLTEGLPELSRQMEVYASERLKRLSIRPPVKAKVGIHPAGNLLELSISDENYSTEELLALLGAYRKGVKYHRLKDGSFALLDNSVAELNELAENLNLKDRDFLKEHIEIPQYRMLYLDSLANGKSVRMQQSGDFRQIVKDYRDKLEDSADDCVPDSLQTILRDYQKKGFRWMHTISAYGFGGILADDMGLGKTLQAIALLLDARQQSTEHVVNLIVCPSSLTLNWVSEIEKFAPQLQAVAVVGTAAVRDKLISQIREYDIVITSYSALTRDIVKYESIRFHYHLIDEAQYIKNHTTQMAKAVKAIQSDIRFALTGTPVENSLAELWSIFDFIMPGYLFDYAHFKKHFEAPIVSDKSESATRGLQKSVSPFILRRLKKDVLSELPDKIETVLVSQMESEQRKLYDANVALVKREMGVISSGMPQERIKILAMLTKLRQICCDPGLIYENFTGKSAKLEQCMELIGTCLASGHKILLFSQFTSMIDRIANRLKAEGISYYTLTGSMKAQERIRLVNAFNEDDTNVFLISLKAGGTGLNLTGADIVIHYDPWWNLSVENQASDRAYRIGQTKNVQIYKLIADRSIEQSILRLQQSKADLSNLAVGGEADITRMSADEILDLLE